MHISISLQHSKKETKAAEENAGKKERERIDELEAIQVRERGVRLTLTKSVLGQRETRLEGLKCPQGFGESFPRTYTITSV